MIPRADAQHRYGSSGAASGIILRPAEPSRHGARRRPLLQRPWNPGRGGVETCLLGHTAANRRQAPYAHNNLDRDTKEATGSPAASPAASANPLRRTDYDVPSIVDIGLGGSTTLLVGSHSSESAAP